MDLRGTQNWIDLLPEITKRINNTPHSRYKFIPAKVNRRNAKDIQKKFYDKTREYRKHTIFRVGDYVRISEFKNLFRRAFIPYWSPAVYRISQVNHKIPQTYKLTEYDGTPIKKTYYAEQLQKTKFPHTWLIEKILKRDKKKCLVRWFGYSSSQDSWVLCKDIFDVTKQKN